ncbi:Sensor protein EvgS precursor [compost metagenome]
MFANADFDGRIACNPIPDCLLLTDALRLQQVIDNILSNSYKYAGTAVTVTSAIADNHLQLEIRDYGQGVDPEELPLLFNKFYRGHNISGQTGAGLGLYISKFLMHSMQGEIECRNHRDGFSVILRIRLV